MEPELLFNRLSPEQKRASLQICKTLQENGHQAFLVGGAVRDLVLGRPVKDLDVATSAHPKQVQSLFKRVIPTGIKHGTVTVLMEGLTVEVTTFRTEQGYSDGRRPDQVRFSDSLEEDLMRRDFTINALALDPIQNVLVDRHGGMADLDARLIRTIGDPMERFGEDGLRPVRACRFSATLGFSIEDTTLQAIHRQEILERARSVAIERFTDELMKALKNPAPISPMIDPLVSSGLLSIFFPSSDGLALSRPGSCEIVDRCLDGSPAFRLALWLFGGQIHTNLNEISSVIGRELRLSNHMVRDLEQYLILLTQVGPGRNSTPSPAELRKLLSGVKSRCGKDSEELLEGICPEGMDPAILQALGEILPRDPLVIRDLSLNGGDLQKLGYSGVGLGNALSSLLERVLEDPKNNEKDTLLELLKNITK